MEQIDDYSDQRLKGGCVHCGSPIATTATSWDHVPTKGLLDRPLPAHVPQVEICAVCNNGFSLDEEYLVTFLSCVLGGTTDGAAQLNEKIARGLERNPSLRERIGASRTEQADMFGETRVEWQPERERVNRVVLKNARGHAFYERPELVRQLERFGRVKAWCSSSVAGCLPVRSHSSAAEGDPGDDQGAC